MVKVTTKKEIDDEIILDKSLIGNSVYAENGEEIGVVKDLYIHPKTFQIKAITVNKGPFKFEHFIESSFIDSIGPGGIILNIIPLEDIKNKKVIDNRGNEIGRIKRINKIKKTNSLISIIVSNGIGNKNFEIKHEDIKSIGQSVILKKAIHELKKS